MITTTSGYLLDNQASPAGQRFAALAALAALFDAVTARHLDVFGVAPGARCWEIGAGPRTPAARRAHGTPGVCPGHRPRHQVDRRRTTRG